MSFLPSSLPFFLPCFPSQRPATLFSESFSGKDTENGVAGLGEEALPSVWRGLERGLERSGEVWRGLERSGEVWRGLEKSGEVWRSLEYPPPYAEPKSTIPIIRPYKEMTIREEPFPPSHLASASISRPVLSHEKT